MKKLKFLFQQTLLISFGILFGIGIEGMICTWLQEQFIIEWYVPFSIIITSILCSIPTLFLVDNENMKKSTYYVCLICHTVALFIIVAIMGFLFKWYTSMKGFIFVVIIFVFVYAFVGIGLRLLSKKDEKQINAVLKGYSDEE